MYESLRFQIHIVEHCNLNCRGCYHFSPLAEPELLSVDEYEKDIVRLSELFDGRMERIMLLGGEPLLHPQVEDFFEISRKNFSTGEIRILTNGLLLKNKQKSFYDSIRENQIGLWVTKYPVAFDYDLEEKRANEFGVELKYFNTEPVKTLGYQPLDVSGKQDAEINFKNCYRAGLCAALKHGKFYSCFIPAEIGSFNKYFCEQINPCKDDWVDIYKAKSKEEIINKMNNPMPFCRYCDRSKAVQNDAFPWMQTEYKEEEWITIENIT